MFWKIFFHAAFDTEFGAFPLPVQEALVASLRVLATLGPQLGRPHADTLKGSKFANMKELRFLADGGVWRAAYAFDPGRNAIVLVAGDKSGGGESRFYRRLISTADRRYADHLARLNKDRTRH